MRRPASLAPGRALARAAGAAALVVAATAAGAPPRQPRRAPPARPPAGAPLAAPRESVPVLRFRTLEEPERVAWVGDTLVVPLPPDPLPANAPDSLRRRGRRGRWRSYAPEVVTVDSAGVAVALQPGEARVEAWTPLGARVVPVRVRAAVRGAVVAPDGPPPGARVIVVAHRDDTRRADTLRTDARGRFHVALGAPDATPYEIRVEPLGDDTARYHAARLRGLRRSALGAVRVALVPTAWTVRGGTYDGVRVPVEPALAAAAVRERGGFWRVARAGEAGDAGGWPVGWPAERLPLPLAFAEDARDIGQVDSLTVWAIARQLERDWGAPLFRPVARSAAAAPDFAGVVLRVDPTIPAAGFATASWDGSGEIAAADVRVRLRSYLHDPRVLTHELLHALGLGHATGWGSVMALHGNASGRVSASDVAYAQLVAAMRRVQRAERAPYGLADAVGRLAP